MVNGFHHNGNGELQITCSRRDDRGRMLVKASYGRLEHVDRFDPLAQFPRMKYREAVVSKFSLPDDAHEAIEEKLISACNAADSTPSIELVRPVVTTLADIEAKPTRWRFDNIIPAGAITMLDGDPGAGKSTIGIDLAARYSRGDGPPPFSAPNGTFDTGNTLLVQVEDDEARTTKPRSVAAGAVAERIHLLRTVQAVDTGENRIVQLPLDVPLIEQIVIERKIGFVVVDVLSAFVQDGFNMNSDSDMRKCLGPIALSAEATGAAWLILRHLNKKEGTRALYRGGGSVAITGAARAAFAVGPNPDDPSENVLVCVKCNLGPKPHGLTYRLEAHADSSRVVWGGQTTLTATDVLSPTNGRAVGKVDQAKQIIADVLATGPRGENEVRGAVEQAGLSSSTYWRARKDLKVKAEKSAFKGEWLLSLATAEGSQDEW